MSKLRVAVFSGGRGTTSICEALAKHPLIELTLLVNAYDDGLSTGRMRAFIPGLLGPSDIRKGYSRLITSQDASAQALKALLEYRVPEGTSFDTGCSILEAIEGGSVAVVDPSIAGYLPALSVGTFNLVREYSRHFLQTAREQAERHPPCVFDFADCSFGNILFGGCFIRNNRDFNKTVADFGVLCGLPGAVVNVTKGENLVLVALKTDGSYLKNEAEVVSKQSSIPISEIFLLPGYLSDSERQELERLDMAGKRDFLNQRSVLPELNPETQELLVNADMIIYGPGTQHSSLLPSYLTAGIAESIAANKKAEKVFIANIRKDNEIQSETANSLCEKLLWYLRRKDSVALPPSELVSKFFFQTADGREVKADDYLNFFAEDFALGLEKVVGTNWEVGSGVHLGGRVVEELLSLLHARAEEELKPYPYMVSIVVPGLNEARTVKSVLHQLTLLNFQPLGLGKEILYVDGGSSDGSFELAKSEEMVSCYQPPNMRGRGDALRYGVSIAQGNVIVFFPSDGEYDPADVLPLVRDILSNECKVAFGSRAVKCVDISERIKTIYKGNYLGYLVSKYGGMALSILSLMLYNRFIADPLTGLKVFEARLLKSLALRARGLDLETELIAKLGLRGIFIVELPVAYRPRRKVDGKKTTIRDGLSALWTLIWLKLTCKRENKVALERYHEKAFDSNPSV